MPRTAFLFVKSYEYSRRTGVHRMSWDEFAEHAARLAELAETFRPDVVVGIAKAGLFPATAVACALRKEIVPVRISRREQDVVVHETPQWRVPLTRGLAGQRTLVVDEIVDSGETLRMVADHARENGAREILTAALVSHSWADPRPDVTALVSDDLILFPWDARVRVAGRWEPHPEIADAVRHLESEPATEELQPSNLRELREDE